MIIVSITAILFIVSCVLCVAVAIEERQFPLEMMKFPLIFGACLLAWLIL